MVKRSVCLFCSLGCGLAYRVSGREAEAIDYDRDNQVNKGALCPRGYYNYELLNHPGRLTQPSIGGIGVSWGEAFSRVRRELQGIDPGSIGIVVSPLASLEEASGAAALAVSLGTKQICAGGDPADQDAYLGSTWQVSEDRPGELADVEASEYILIIGDILTRSPVLSKRINNVKYGKKGARIVVIDPNRSHAAWFATEHLKNKPGSEAILLAALIGLLKRKDEAEILPLIEKIGVPIDVLKRVSEELAAATAGTVIVSPGVNKKRNDLVVYFARVLAGLAANKKWLVFYSGGDTIGVNAAIDAFCPGHAPYHELKKKLDQGAIQGIFLLGEDLSDLEPLVGGAKLVVRTRYFPAKKNNAEEVIFPLASHLETQGRYIFSGSRLVEAGAVVEPAGGKSNLVMLGELFDLEVEALVSRVNEVKPGQNRELFDLEKVIAEVGKIGPAGEILPEEITHFAGNDLAKNFFWYRANNKG